MCMKKLNFLVVLFLMACSNAIYAQIHYPSGYDVAAIRDFRYKLMADPYRPTYHFAIPEDYAVTFDPNGCIYWNGRYHMFHIYQDRGVHVFAHLSSLDMVHWIEHPKAIYPTDETEVAGIFSGNCFVNKEGVATMIYHGVGQGNSISFSSDPFLNKWKQLPSNPIIPNPKNGTSIANEVNRDDYEVPYASWDPYGWIEGDTYYAIFGGQRPAIFKATELDKWSYVGDLFGSYLPDVPKTEDVSCPDFFDLGDKKVLLCISHNLGCRYYIGTWKNEQFFPESHSMMTFADNTYFAPESLLTPDGRRVMWAWIFDARNAEDVQKSGWSGMMSLPRELFLKADKTMGMRPIKELNSLRHNEKHLKDFKVINTKAIDGIGGDTKEIYVEIDLQKASKCGVKFMESKDGKEYGLVYYDNDQKKIVLDVSHLKAIESAPKTPLGLPFMPMESTSFELAKGENLKLNIFIDKSIVEIYANETVALVRTNAFSSVDSEKNISVFAEGGEVKCKEFKAWDMIGTNPY